MKNHLTLITCLAVFVSGCSFMGDVSRAVGGMYNGIGTAFDKEGQRREAAKASKNSNKSNQNQPEKAADTTTTTQKAKSSTKKSSEEKPSKKPDENKTTDNEKSEQAANTGKGTGEIAALRNGQFDISAAGGFSGNRSTTYAKWDRTAKLACKGGKYKIIKREWQSAEYPGLLGGIIECANKKKP